MNFVDLYRYANDYDTKSDAIFIPVKAIRAKIVENSAYVGDIIFYSMPLDKNVSRGHIRVFRERTSPYDEDYNVLSIRISQDLNRCWKRFVLCKEMMHAFDPSISRTNNAEKFIELLDELEHNPLLDNASKQYESERTAEWQSLFMGLA